MIKKEFYPFIQKSIDNGFDFTYIEQALVNQGKDHQDVKDTIKAFQGTSKLPTETTLPEDDFIQKAKDRFKSWLVFLIPTIIVLIGGAIILYFLLR